MQQSAHKPTAKHSFHWPSGLMSAARSAHPPTASPACSVLTFMPGIGFSTLVSSLSSSAWLEGSCPEATASETAVATSLGRPCFASTPTTSCDTPAVVVLATEVAKLAAAAVLVAFLVEAVEARALLPAPTLLLALVLATEALRVRLFFTTAVATAVAAVVAAASVPASSATPPNPLLFVPASKLLLLLLLLSPVLLAAPPSCSLRAFLAAAPPLERIRVTRERILSALTSAAAAPDGPATAGDSAPVRDDKAAALDVLVVAALLLS